MRCEFHDLRELAMIRARLARIVGKPYQQHVDRARHWNWLIVALLLEEPNGEDNFG